MIIIAVDWGKDSQKRSAYLWELNSCTISRLPFGGSLAELVRYASSLASPVLIGIDAAIGFPASSWTRLHQQDLNPPRTFADFLLGQSLPADFFEPVTKPEEWSPWRPFIRPSIGRWPLQAFVEASRHGLYRQIDRRLQGKPIFVMRGIPGSVGSGTRALWQKLITLKDSLPFRLWPFHGPLEDLLKGDEPVIAEIYPKACYGIATTDYLPAPLLQVAKTSKHARRDILAKLQSTHWLTREQITISDLDAALANEDDFDALLSAAALTRIYLENAPFESHETTDAVAEGGVLGAASLSMTVKWAVKVNSKLSAPSGTPPDLVSRIYPCPIPGCNHVFRNSRGGWDAHVGSHTRHPNWHPEVRDAHKRKKLFRVEFPDWFS